MMLKDLIAKTSVIILLLLLCVAGRAEAQSVEAADASSQKYLKVVSSNPAANETNVFTDTAVFVTFNVRLRCKSVNKSTFKVFGPDKTTRVTGTLACDGDSVTFTPSENLAPESKYIVKINCDVTAYNGEYLNTRQWYFMTGAGTRPPFTPTPTATRYANCDSNRDIYGNRNPDRDRLLNSD